MLYLVEVGLSYRTSPNNTGFISHPVAVEAESLDHARARAETAVVLWFRSLPGYAGKATVTEITSRDYSVGRPFEGTTIYLSSKIAPIIDPYFGG